MNSARRSQTRLLAPRRQDEILARISKAGSVVVSELADFFAVSRETIRRCRAFE